MSFSNKTFNLAILCLLLSGMAVCQSHFDGYIITNKHDTIHGWIQIQSNYLNMQECLFIKDKSVKAEKFLPSDIHAYGVGNNHLYISKTYTSKGISTSAFIEALVLGKVNLYYGKTQDGDIFFVEKDSKLYELTNEKREVVENNTKYLKESKHYLRVLAMVFSDNQEIKHKIQNVSFDYKSLVRITKNYHKTLCNGCMDYVKSTESKIFMEPHMGIVSSSMGLKDSDDVSTNVSPIIGINFRFLPFKSNSSLNFITGLSYSRNSFNKDFINSIVEPNFTHRIEAKYSTIRIPITLEYAFSSKRFSPFLFMTYKNIFIINPEFSVKNVYYYPNGEEHYTSSRPSEFRRYQIGLSGGGGLRYKFNNDSYVHLITDAEARWSSINTNHILDYQYVKSLTFMIGYGFKL
jgi:hypothetical protein